MVVGMLRTARKLFLFRRVLCGEHMVDRTIGYENREGRAHERRVAGRKRRWSEGWGVQWTGVADVQLA